MSNHVSASEFKSSEVSSDSSAELSLNSFSGPVPTSVGSLTKLSTFYMFDGGFDGPLSGFLCSLLRLSDFRFGSNSLSGVLPACISQLTNLTTLSLANNQLTETTSNEYVIGTGYRIQDVKFSFFSGGRGKKMTSDLDLKLDLNIRNNKTVIRKVIEDQQQITMGQQIISIKFSADYVMNQRLNLKLFYDRVVTNPFISTTFPGAITNAGFSLRFTLAG